MSSPEIEVEVVTARPRVELVPRSHLSIELGHLYMEDLLHPERIREHFAKIKPWTDFLLTRHAGQRVSTCFLVDEYFSKIRSPAELIPELIEAASAEGIVIDYLARESGCAEAGGVSPASLVMARVVPDPPQGANGSRPPAHETGWLTNAEGMRTSLNQAMAGRRWAPPKENGALAHSVCLDVQLWDNPLDGERRWSCAFLSAVWQLLRLGLLRHQGKAIVTPDQWKGPYPDAWSELPAVIKLGERAQPFYAFRTMTVLETRFSDVEAAVRMILGRVAIDPVVAAQVRQQAAAQNVELPDDIVRRVSHVFSDGI
ncbi:SCO2522 family protein [Actinocorallia longicatena]|uniref:SCO2522 family protein n=1 Tax=Actinocorallia longicatena TaxID=111803 RepID=A0ABP6Q9L6_9ACTN